MDEDLAEMPRGQLVAELKKLRQGIRQHPDSSEHELCWHHPALWGLLPERTDPIPRNSRGSRVSVSVPRGEDRLRR